MGFLKGKLARGSWAIEAVVEAVCRGHGRGTLGRHRGFQIGIEGATILPRFSLQNSHDFCHDRATIGRRSGHDRGLIVILGLCRLPCDPVEAIPRRKLHDCGSIAPRPRFDRTAIVEFFHESS